jgi:hypothetical protein
MQKKIGGSRPGRLRAGGEAGRDSPDDERRKGSSWKKGHAAPNPNPNPNLNLLIL